MRRSLPIPVAVAVAAAAGCGGGDGAGPPAVAPTATASGSARVPECAAAGIDARGGRTGTCRVGQVVRTVGDRGETLVIDDEVEVRLADLDLRRAAGDVLVRVTLRVRNTSPAAVRWPAAPSQLALYLGEDLVPQSGRDRVAALRGRGRPVVRLRPGATGRLAAGWRLSRRVAGRLEARGSAIILVPPSEQEFEATTVPDALRLGVIRLWK